MIRKSPIQQSFSKILDSSQDSQRLLNWNGKFPDIPEHEGWIIPLNVRSCSVRRHNTCVFPNVIAGACFRSSILVCDIRRDQYVLHILYVSLKIVNPWSLFCFYICGSYTSRMPHCIGLYRQSVVSNTNLRYVSCFPSMSLSYHPIVV